MKTFAISSKIALSARVSTIAAASMFALACSSATPGTDTDPQPSTTKASLVFKSPCAASSCPSVPAGSADAYLCAEGNGACAWSAGGGGVVGNREDPNRAVSYRECADTECTSPEIPADCPSGTHSLGLRCGSENEAACARYAVCVPNEEDAGPATVTCNPDSCGPVPELAELCSDGSSAGLVCRAKGSKCTFQSGCPAKP